MTAPLKPANSADLGTASARDWVLRVNTSTTVTPTWVFVNGLSKISPTNSQTFQDDADLNARGFKSELATATGFMIDCDGLRKGLLAAGVLTPDPGQEYLRAKSLQTGYANIAEVQWYRTDDLPESYSGKVAVEYKETGGDKEALQQFTITLHGRGAPVTIAKPTV